LVKNVVKQAKKYQEKLEELGKKQDIEDDELEALKVQLPTWWDYELQAEKEKDLDKKDHKTIKPFNFNNEILLC
jgi:hypothetical protein